MPDKAKPFDFGKRGKPRGWTPVCEGDHYEYCKQCRQWFDLRDLGQLLHHDQPGHKSSQKI